MERGVYYSVNDSIERIIFVYPIGNNDDISLFKGMWGQLVESNPFLNSFFDIYES
jgi:hypothetical protein